MKTVTSKDGTTIALDQWGSGPALILVGGALATRSASPPVAALLAPHLTVFGYDRRGRGDSGDTMPYAVEREVDDIQALITAAGGRTSLFGHSSGAALALEAVSRGLAVQKLALYEPPFIVDGGRAPLPEDFVAHLTDLAASGRRREALEYFMTTAMGMPPAAVSGMQRDPGWSGFEAIAQTLAYDGAILGNHMSGAPLEAGEFAAVTVPTLVMDGSNSPGWQHTSVRALVAALPNARHMTLEGQAHGAAPEVLAPVLVEFFTS